MFLNPGLVFKNATTSVYTLANGFPLQTAATEDNLSREFEVEVNFKPLGFVSLSGMLVGVPYLTPTNASNGEPDRQIELAALPRLQTGGAGVVFWGGVAIGIRWLTIGTPSRAGTSLEYSLASTPPIATLTPRAGVDFILEGYTFGLSGSYTRESRTLTGSARDPNTGISSPLLVQQTRAWWSLQARFGFQL